MSCAHAEPIAGLDAVLRAHRVILIGEIHGTTEIPRAVGDIVARAAERGPVLLVIERDMAEQAALEAAAAAGDRATLVASGLWVTDYQDGRSSEAMADLVMRVHALRAAGRDVAIAAYDDPSERRDPEMARKLAAIIADHPRAQVIVLTGNIHARLSIGFPGDPTFVTMGSELIKRVPSAEVFSIDALADHGSMWVCMDADGAHCGVHTTAEPGPGPRPPVIRLREPPRDGYDAGLDLGSVTASLPAGRTSANVAPPPGVAR